VKKKKRKQKKIQPGVGIVRFGGHPEPSRAVSLLWVAKHRRRNDHAPRDLPGHDRPLPTPRPVCFQRCTLPSFVPPWFFFLLLLHFVSSSFVT
jgi:hypothetical protein